MGIKERKIRERENLRRLILANAQELLMKSGLEGLHMRAIANQIEYSQSKIYEFFASKDELCVALCNELCEKLLTLLQQLPKSSDPEKVLTQLFMTTIEFHASHPHSDALFTFVCFGPQRFNIPKAFLEVEKLFIEALKNLKSPYIKNDEHISASLDIIRCLFIGMSTLMSGETSIQAKGRVLKMAKNALPILLRGWKK